MHSRRQRVLQAQLVDCFLTGKVHLSVKVYAGPQRILGGLLVIDSISRHKLPKGDMQLQASLGKGYVSHHYTLPVDIVRAICTSSIGICPYFDCENPVSF